VTSRQDQLAAELRAVIRLAARRPEELLGRIPLLASFAQVRERQLDPASPETLLFVVSRLVPNLLTRLPAGPDGQAIRELFRWEEADGQFRNLTARYHHAAGHLTHPAADFARRQEPRLLSECARRFLLLDFDDTENYNAGIDAPVLAFWAFGGSAGVHLVFPELDKAERIRQGELHSRDHIRLAKFADLDTLLELRSFFARFFPRVPVGDCTWPETSEAILRSDVVNVGGPYYNKLTAQLLARMNSPLGQVLSPPGTPDSLTDYVTKTTYAPQYSGDLVTCDYGLFLSGVNPNNADRRLTIITGVLTHGVLGACRAFTDPGEAPRNVEAVLDHTDHARAFAAIIRVPVIADTVPAPKLYDGDLVAAYALSSPS
jgi:hypothetical protein